MSFGRAVPDPFYATKEHRERMRNAEVIHAPNALRNEDDRTKTLWESNPVGPDANVTKLQTVKVVGPAKEPHYVDPSYGKDQKAEAVAKAVRLAVERGEIDPDTLL